MDQTGMSQIQMALECVSKDLDRVQSSLSTYEQMLLKSERVTPQLKEVVVYYRDQVTGLRKEMLGLCNLLTVIYRNTCVKETVVPNVAELQLPQMGVLVPTPAPAVEVWATTQAPVEQAKVYDAELAEELPETQSQV